MAFGTEKLGREVLLNAAKTSMSSKFISAEEDFFAELVVDAVTDVKFMSDSGNVSYPIKSVNVLKAHGKGTKESKLLPVVLLGLGLLSELFPEGLCHFAKSRGTRDAQ